jgi:AraC-like DNA-binding protein
VGHHWSQEHIVRPGGYLYQWIQCVQGEGELITGGKTFRIKEGTGMLLFKGVPHEYYAISSTWITDWIVFDGRQVGLFLQQTAGFASTTALFVSRPDILLARVQQLLDIGHSDATLKSLKSSAVIYSLLTDIMQHTSVHPNNSATNLNFKLKPLFQYIDQNYHTQLTLDAMAGLTGMTPQHLCTVFKKTTNIRIFQYINSVRIKKSKELLLQHPHMQVKDIAALSGFEDANYFSSVFKKQEQITPNQFRKIHH